MKPNGEPDDFTWMWSLLIIALIISNGITAFFFYNYWYDNEYPHGSLYCSPDEIELFYGGWYCDIPFIKIGKVYEIQDFDVEKEMLARFNDWHNVSYVLNVSTWCEGKPLRTYIIDDYRDFSFEITYHTYDSPQPGIDIFYSKQLVIDDFRISSWRT